MMRVKFRKDLFDLGKKMTVDKQEMYRYLLCEKTLFNEAKKEKKKEKRVIMRS